MIVISGALVLVALVLLIIGVVGPDLTFVYASIAVSLVSLVFLVIGILQRRGETAPAADAAPAQKPAPEAEAEGVTTVLPAQSRRVSTDRDEEPAPVADTVDEELETGGTVLIVEGRPRYHVDGCRYLTNKSAEKIDVLDAREEGFSPCGVCKPDEALDALPAEPVTEELALEEEPAEEPVVEEDVPGVEVPPARTKAPAKKAARKAPAKKAASSTRTVPAAPAKAPTKAPTRTASKAKAPSGSAAKAAAAATAATPVAASARRTGSVVVIPDRGKFHRAECRYVRDVDGAEVLSKSAAGRQGYAACGVCKP